MRRHRHDISSTSQPTSTTNDDLKQESPRDTPSSQRTRMENESIEAFEKSGYPQGPKEVMVLQVTEPFGIGGEKKMFHATVATETEFFRVKVFVIVLKEKFIPNKLIAISEYYARNGFLETYSASCVSDVNGNCVMYVPSALRERATVTPKIIHLCSHRREIFVNGDFNVFKKHVRNECTYYGIGDDTGIMEVVVYGRLTNIDCEPGDRLRLFCFELASSAHRWQLRSVRHSYMQCGGLSLTFLEVPPRSATFTPGGLFPLHGMPADLGEQSTLKGHQRGKQETTTQP